MATVETIKRKKGDAYCVRFYRDARRFKITLPIGMSRAQVDELARVVVALNDAAKYAEEPPRRVAQYLATAPRIVLEKLAAVGLIQIERALDLQEAATAYLARAERELKPRTLIIRRAAFRRLVDFFGAARAVSSITPVDAHDFVLSLADRFSQSTIEMTVAAIKAFFGSLVASNTLSANPWAKIPVKVGTRLERAYNVPSEWTPLILDACPSTAARALFVLYRYGALRAGEAVALKWSHVNWERRRLIVPSRKTERFDGRGSRVVPLFPEIEVELSDYFETLQEGAPDAMFQLNEAQAYNLIKRVVERAGLVPWAKLLQNMRATRENELVEAGYPPHVVAAWLGHTTRTQERYYLRVLDSYFDRATTSPKTGAKTGSILSETR